LKHYISTHGKGALEEITKTKKTHDTNDGWLSHKPKKRGLGYKNHGLAWGFYETNNVDLISKTKVPYLA